MAAHVDFTAFSDDALARQRELARAQVYSRQGQQEEPGEFTDPVTGRTVLLRASEWRLLQLERELARRAAQPVAAGPAGGGHRREPDTARDRDDDADAGAPASARGRADSRRLLRRSAAPFGVGLIVGIAAALTTTGMLLPGVSIFGVGSAQQTPTPTPVAGEHLALLKDGTLREPAVAGAPDSLKDDDGELASQRR